MITLNQILEGVDPLCLRICNPWESEKWTRSPETKCKMHLNHRHQWHIFKWTTRVNLNPKGSELSTDQTPQMKEEKRSQLSEKQRKPDPSWATTPVLITTQMRVGLQICSQLTSSVTSCWGMTASSQIMLTTPCCSNFLTHTWCVRTWYPWWRKCLEVLRPKTTSFWGPGRPFKTRLLCSTSLATFHSTTQSSTTFLD